MTPNEIEENEQRFISLCHEHIQRDGLDKILAYLEKTDFYVAPSSTNFHLNEDGGLCKHSLNVFDTACKLYHSVAAPSIKDGSSPFTEEVSMESLAIVTSSLSRSSTTYAKSNSTTKQNDGRRMKIIDGCPTKATS